jgi:hypothetical protein
MDASHHHTGNGTSHHNGSAAHNGGSFQHHREVEDTVHKIEKILQHNPHDLAHVYTEIEHLRRHDPKHFNADLHFVNKELHAHKYFPNIEIVQHDHVGKHNLGKHHIGRHDVGTHTIDKAIQLAGLPVTAANEAAVIKIVQRESSWNPNVTNHKDRNARAGHPSTGLMQTIPSTFKEYALPGYNTNIHDPLSNLVAGIRYAQAKYARGGRSGVEVVASRSGGY